LPHKTVVVDLDLDLALTWVLVIVDFDGDSNVDRDAATWTLRPAPIPRRPPRLCGAAPSAGSWIDEPPVSVRQCPAPLPQTHCRRQPTM